MVFAAPEIIPDLFHYSRKKEEEDQSTEAKRRIGPAAKAEHDTINLATVAAAADQNRSAAPNT
jgi:hypothetical protein